MTSEATQYDWAEGRRGELLIYKGRKPNRNDPGCWNQKDNGCLIDLYHKGRLTGQALEDARLLYPAIPKQSPIQITSVLRIATYN